ncbi:hypothetical protein ACWEN6_03445 [Sphaerisporangium sp. NPDC004334]
MTLNFSVISAPGGRPMGTRRGRFHDEPRNGARMTVAAGNAAGRFTRADEIS